MSKPKEKDPINCIVTGSRYQVMNEKGEPQPEFGLTVFRNGIRLRLASDLYLEMVNRQAITGSDIDVKAVARRLAANAFALTEVFLDEMDKHFRVNPPPDNNNSGRK